MNPQPGRKEISHERIVGAAARAIRRGGFDGVGVADIMKAAGLTHGGFYAHFSSRDAMLAEAVDLAGLESAARLAQGMAVRQARGAGALRALVETYLSERHLDEVEAGCPVAALAAEIPRQSPEVQAAAARRVHGLLALVRAALPPGAAAESAALVAGQLVGTLQLARALGSKAQGLALLKATRRALLAQHEPGPSA